MRNQSRLGLVVLGAFDTVVTAQSRKILSSLGLLELLEVLGRLEVGLDLVEISATS